MKFVELLVAEVHHLEIVRGRLPGGLLPGATVEPGGFARYAFKKIRFWAINIGNDLNKEKHCDMVYYRFLEHTGQPGGRKLELWRSSIERTW